MNQRRTQEVKLFGIIGILLAMAAMIMEYRPSGSAVEWVPYGEAFRRAAEEQKAVYVDVYAEWCSPCKEMDRTTFSDDSVVHLLQNNLVAVRVNIDDEGTGADIKKKFNIQAMPTSLLLTPSGQEIKRHVGYLNSAQFLEWTADTVGILFALWNNLPTARAMAMKEKKKLLVLVIQDSASIPSLQKELRRPEIRKGLNKKFIPTLLVVTNPAHNTFIRQYSLSPSIDFIATFTSFSPQTMEIVQVLPVRQSDMVRFRYIFLPLLGEDPL